jgi:hypothetical protein
MKYTLSILFATSFILSIAQNPLKTALKGNTQSAFYNKTQYQLKSEKRDPIYIADLVDNRPNNWNKQINDSIKVELIRDFWTFPYKHNFKEKINQDFQNFKYSLLPTKAGATYVLSPSVEVHYPNFIYDPKGYKIYTRVNMKLVKENNTVLEKAYDDFYFFTKGEIDWQDSYNSEYLEGTNYAMWISMRRVLDKFYADFDAIIEGKEVTPGNLPLKVDAIASNIAKDESLNKQQKPYSTVKEDDKYKPAKTESTTAEYANNTVKVEAKTDKTTTNTPTDKTKTIIEEKPKEEFKKPEPPAANNKDLDNAMAVLGVKSTNPPLDAKTEADRKASMELAIKKSKEGEKKKMMDSIQSVKEKEAQIAKEKSEKEKNQTVSLTKAQKEKLDSIKNANLLALKAKENKKRIEDSIKKADVNKNMELAKLEKEKAKAKLTQESKEKIEEKSTKETQLALSKKEKEKEAIKAELAKEAELAKARKEKETQASKIKANREILTAKENEAKAQKEKLEKEARMAKEAQLAKEKAEKEALLAKEKEAKIQKEKMEKEALLAKEKAKKEMVEKTTSAKTKKDTSALQKEEIAATNIQKPANENLKQNPKLEQELAKLKNNVKNQDPIAQLNKNKNSNKIDIMPESSSKIEEKPMTVTEAKIATPEVKETKKVEIAKAKETAKTQIAKAEVPVKIEPIKGKETAQLPKPKLDKDYTREDYLKDSLYYAYEKERKREAILAAQKAAFEMEKNSVNIINGQVVSNDPPSKLPDTRTPEERAKDRIFTPQNDASKELLARVVMITKDDEKSFEKILENYDPISRKEFLDSIAIARQMSKPKNEKKNIIEDITVPKTTKEDLPKVNEVPKSTNLINKTAANIKSTASNALNNAKTSAPATMVKEIGGKAAEDAKTAILNKKMEEDLKAKANAILPQKTTTTSTPATSVKAASTPTTPVAPTSTPKPTAPATTATPATNVSTPATTSKPTMTIETPATPATPEPKKRSARLVIEE